jgi:hypothetical protein
MATKNAPTLHQIKMTCRHVIELRKTGMTENIAIRLLEQLTNMYGKFRVLGHVSPDHADQFDHWSKAARKAKAANPKANMACTCAMNSRRLMSFASGTANDHVTASRGARIFR